MPPPAINMVGQPVGEWTVLRRARLDEIEARANRSQAFWLCRCSCGREKAIRGQALRNGESTRCRACDGKSRRLRNQCSCGEKNRAKYARHVVSWCRACDRRRLRNGVCECGRARYRTFPCDCGRES